MELIEHGAVSPLEGSSDLVIVLHRDAELAAPLEVGDEVVLGEPDGEYRAGEVVTLATRDGEAAYVLRLGVRLPSGLAQERLAGDVRPAGQRGPYTTQSVADLLGQLRRSTVARDDADQDGADRDRADRAAGPA